MISLVARSPQASGDDHAGLPQSHTDKLEIVQAAPLLRLPQELCDRIDGYVYLDRKSSTAARKRAKLQSSSWVSSTSLRFSPTIHFREHIALTQTCRQLRTETRFLPYKPCGFVVKVATPILPIHRHCVRAQKDTWCASPALIAIAKYLRVLGAAVAMMDTLLVVEGGRCGSTYSLTKKIKDARKVVEIKLEGSKVHLLGVGCALIQQVMRILFASYVEVFEEAGFAVEWYFGSDMILEDIKIRSWMTES
ncbi:hypothetical protein LTR78_006446 [Recurvomyces mirabilis]|uniref:Uncharacterized protein n=1 Tax=Recurvomyces mirabilis TaxID=574656 RepID=A0AAE0WKT1_9PEZI|nr:hypothetical protein LTR78_006446 [Recurvomyces mirabilis]KAK5151135.1 hypothetical protein LTS14_009631 [Recurvomyces mirabilis]